MTVNQPSLAPTRKLSAAVIAAALVETARTFADMAWPGTFDGAFWIALLPLVIYGVGFWVKDEPNVAPEFRGENV